MTDAHYHRGGYATFLSPSVHIRDTENDIEETNDRITYLDVIAKELNVMDSTAITLCHDNSMPIIVFDIEQPGVIDAALRGENVGTTVYRED